MAVGVAVVLVAGGAPAVAGDPAPGGVSPGARGGPQSVTLITGDRVLVGVDGSAGELVAGPGREGVGFSTFQADGHDYVVPLDAGPLVGSGKLDRRLFDVTGLVEDGYDDASMNSLPLLVTYAEGTEPGVGVQDAPGMAVERKLPSINGAAARADKSSLAEAWRGLTARGSPGAAPTTLAAGIEKIWLDGRYEATLDVSVPQIGAPAAWEAGFTGEDVRIAVLDSGVDESHPDLAGREVAEQNFSDAETGQDMAGHGTHVASIAAGAGDASDGTYTGVAHGAQYVDGKVLNDLGIGFASWIIAGMEWAAIEQDADIANLSLGGPNTPRIDPVEEALNTLTAEEGTLFVVAAGNLGPRPSTVESPASARNALAVGAVDDQNQIAEFSARGPLPGARAVKPEITGPGVDIVAARSSHGLIGEPVGERYTELSGTSMASPHVAGAAALLLDQHPDLGASEVKGMVMASARPTEGATLHEQGVGRVDSASGVEQTLYAQPANAAFGVQEWPHYDEEPARQEITYTNLGDTPATLELTLNVTGPGGEPAPAGLLALSENQLTVPANGTAAVTLIGDVNAVNDHELYSGILLARTTGEPAGQTVRTPVNIKREPESYDLTLRNIGRDGTLTGDYFMTLVDVDDYDIEFPYEQDGTLTLRLPRGEYLLESVIRTGEGQDQYRDLLAYPELRLTRDTAIDFDARAAEPIHLNTPNPDAEAVFGQVRYTRVVDGQRFTSDLSVIDAPIERLGSAHLGPRLPRDELTALVNTQWVTPDGAEYYGLAWYEYGAVPTGFVRLVRPQDLATVHARYGAIRADTVGGAGASPSEHRQPRRVYGMLVDIPLPFERTEYYNIDDRQVDWNRSLYTSAENRFLSALQAPPRQFLPGRTYTERFNNAVFGPVLPVTYEPDRWVTRNGDVIDVDVPVFGDGNGNWGRANYDTASTRLYRDGELVDELPTSGVGRFEVPAAPAEYRLAVETTRSEAFGLTTRVATAWTFRSATTAEPTRLPISTIRYFPALDENDSAPSGQVFTIPVAVQEQATGATRTPHRITAEVSYDHGRTWTPAGVIAGGSALRVHHPNNAETVSLRATAHDGSGNAVEQTLIDAYRLR